MMTCVCCLLEGVFQKIVHPYISFSCAGEVLSTASSISEQRNFYDIYLRSEGSQQRGAGSAGCIGGDYLGQDTVGPPGGDPINCIMM